MVFQFGDFFNSSSTNPYLIELIRATYTIIIFFLGIWYARYRDEEKSFKERKDLRQYIYALVESLDKPFDAQIEALNYFVVHMRIDDQESIPIDRVPEFSMDNLKQQPDNDLFKAFVLKLEDNGDKISSFINFKATVEYFDKVIKESISSYYEDFYIKNQEFADRLNICGNNVVALVRTISLNDNDEIGREIREINLDFIQKSQLNQDKPNQSFFTYENLIIPLFEICRRNQYDNRCVEMIKDLVAYRSAVDLFIRDREFYSAHFVALIDTMKIQKKKMDKSIAHLKRLSPKKVNLFKV